MASRDKYERVLLKAAFSDLDARNQILQLAPEDFFSDELHDLFFKTIKFIHEGGLPVNKTSVSDVLKESGNDVHIDEFNELVSANYDDEKDWKYHLNAHITFYNRAKMFGIAQRITQNTIQWDIKQMYAYLDASKDELIFPKHQIKNMQSVISEVQSSVESDNLNSLKTGNEDFDKTVSLFMETVLLIAGGKGSGKSRFTLFLIDRVLSLNSGVSVMWLNFEMSNSNMVQLFVARRTGLTTKEISQKTRLLSKDEKQKVESALEEISHMDVEFCSNPMSIKEVKTEFKKFCSRRPGRKHILVIDNLGLLTNGGKNQNDVDEYVAKQIVQIREDTKALIIPIHHLSKEHGTRSNLKNGYAPKIEDVRGSSRIPDYSNQVLLVHKPSNFKDLMIQEEMKGTYTSAKSGNTIDRAKTLEKLILLDVAKNRDDTQKVIRYESNLGLCRFREWSI